MKSTMLKSLIIALFATQIASVQAARPDGDTEISKAARATDRTDLGVSADDRSVNGDDTESETSETKAEQDDKKEDTETAQADNEELKDKDGGTADVQVVYRIHGALDRNLRKQTEDEMSEAMCDREAYEDCDEIDIEVDSKHFDVISYDVLDSSNSDGSHQDRTDVNRRPERSTEVVYRKNGEPAYDRSHRIRLRERGSNQIYIATMREGEKEDEVTEEGSSTARNRTLWLSRLERSNGEAN